MSIETKLSTLASTIGSDIKTLRQDVEAISAVGYPTIRPSLNLDFANSKTVDPRITFTRASTATYYDGKTFAKAEENLHLNSQTMASWTASQMGVTDNSIAAPDGTTTATLLVPTASAARHYIFSNSSTGFTESGANVTASIFAKAGTYGFCYVQVNNNTAGGGVRFTRSIDLSTGTVGGFSSDSNVSGQSITVTSAGNGWYRIVMTCTSTVAGGSGGWNIIIGPMPNNGSGFANGGDFLPTYTADGTSGTYFWGAQLEQRSTVTAYTPTTTQPITNYIPQLLTAASNAPRIDHDPVTGVCKGLLIEEARTNLLTQSEFGTGLIGAVGLVTASSMFSALGTNAVAAAFGSDGTTTSYLYKGTVPASTQITISVYVKMDDGNPPEFSVSNSSNDFRLVIAGVAVDSLTYAVTHVGNGLYRVSGTLSTGITALSNNGIVKYTSNSTRTFKTTAWQLEAGAFPTSYIPTTTAAATRAAELASMTGTNFSSWYRQDEGTFFIENNYNSGSGLVNSNRVALSTRSAGDDRIYIYNSSGANSYYGKSIGLTSWFAGGPANTADFVTTAAAYKFNDIAVSSEGAVVSTDTSATLPRDQNTLWIGSTSTAQLSGYIKKIAYYPKRLSNAELQTITAA